MNTVSKFIAILFGCILGMYSSYAMASQSYGVDKKKDPVPLDGRWNERERSISDEISIGIFWDGTYLGILRK